MMDYSWRSVGGVWLGPIELGHMGPPFLNDTVSIRRCCVMCICIRPIHFIQIWFLALGKPKCNLTVFPGMYQE